MAYSAKTIPFIQGGVAGTESHIDWICDPAFAGRSVQPVGLVCPGGGEEGEAPVVGGSGFNIDIRAPHLDILSRTGDAVGVIAYGTDTEDIYVFDGTHWQTYENS